MAYYDVEIKEATLPEAENFRLAVIASRSWLPSKKENHMEELLKYHTKEFIEHLLYLKTNNRELPASFFIEEIKKDLDRQGIKY